LILNCVLAPFESTSEAYMITEVISVNETKVKWGFYGSMDYPLIYCCLYAKWRRLLGMTYKQD
jgi:hypothetical protein